MCMYVCVCAAIFTGFPYHWAVKWADCPPPPRQVPADLTPWQQDVGEPVDWGLWSFSWLQSSNFRAPFHAVVVSFLKISVSLRYNWHKIIRWFKLSWKILTWFNIHVPCERIPSIVCVWHVYVHLCVQYVYVYICEHMYVYMCACVCIYVHMRVCMLMCVCMCVYACASVCKHTCMCARVHISVHVCTHTRAHMWMCVCVCACMCMYMCVCVNI